MKHRFLVMTLGTVALLAAIALPTNAGKTTLGSLAKQVDSLARKVRNLSKTGTMSAQYITYSANTSGLQGKTIQAAVDEVGIGLAELISTKQVATNTNASNAGMTTWTATTYGVCTNELKTATATVSFTPSATDKTAGTWTATPYNIFNPGIGAGICFGSATSQTFSGSYTVVEDMILTYNVQVDTGEQPTVGYTAMGQVRGNTIVLTDTRTSPQLLSELVRQ